MYRLGRTKGENTKVEAEDNIVLFIGGHKFVNPLITKLTFSFTR